MASNFPDIDADRPRLAPMIISAVFAVVLTALIGAIGLTTQPQGTLTASLTALPQQAAGQAPTPAPAATPRPATGAPGSAASGPPPEPGRGNPTNGARLFTSLACNACHSVPGGSAQQIGPAMNNVGNLAATRRPGYSAGQYLVEAIVNPNAHLVEGYQANLMPQTYGTLTASQINDLVAYMLTLKQ